MISYAQTREEINKIAELIREAIPVESIYLFGSHAYGQPNEDSDYDFFVVIPDGSMRALDANICARKALSKLPDRQTPIDILADYSSRFHERKQFNTLERKVFNEGVVLYGQA